MERAAIEELVEYTDFSWERHAKVMDTLSPEQFTAPVPGSGWPTLQRAFLHVVGAYDGWLNDDWGLNGGDFLFPAVETWDELFAMVPSWEKLQEYRVATRNALRKALQARDDEIFAKREFVLGFGPEQLSPADIITNLLMHERGHHGDISTLFDQLGLKSDLVDWRFFITRRDEFVPDTDDD